LTDILKSATEQQPSVLIFHELYLCDTYPQYG
jgi:hypothetical protein